MSEEKNDNGYLLVKDNQGEVLGIFVVTHEHARDIITSSICKKLDEAFGCKDWSPEVITKAEFETYKEFGFKEYTI